MIESSVFRANLILNNLNGFTILFRLCLSACLLACTSTDPLGTSADSCVVEKKIEGGLQFRCGEDTITVSDQEPCYLEDTDDSALTRLVCSGGSDDLIGDDANRVVRTTLEAGQTFSLEHGLKNAFVDANYIEGGFVYALNDFIHAQSPVSEQSIGIIENENGVENYRRELLSDGNFLLYSEGFFFILSPLGETLLPSTEYADDYRCSPSASALPDGFVVAMTHCDDETLVDIRMYLNDGAAQSFEALESDVIELSDHINGGRHSVVATPNGGFAYAGVYQKSVSKRALRILRFTKNGSAIGGTFELEIDNAQSDGVSLATLQNDGLLALYGEREGPAEPYLRTHAVALNADDGIVSSTVVVNSSVINVAEPQVAANGNILFSYEVESSRALAFSVFDAQGQALALNVLLSAVDPQFISSIALGDGDFMIAMSGEPESSEEGEATSAGPTMLWNIGNQGQVVHEAPMFLGDTSPPFGRVLMFAREEHEVDAIYRKTFDGRNYQVHLSKNMLRLEMRSDDEVVLHNHSFRDVEVVLSVVGQR